MSLFLLMTRDFYYLTKWLFHQIEVDIVLFHKSNLDIFLE